MMGGLPRHLTCRQHTKNTHLGVDCNGVNTVELAGAYDTARNLSTVGDQHLGRRVLKVVRSSGGSACVLCCMLYVWW